MLGKLRQHSLAITLVAALVIALAIIGTHLWSAAMRPYPARRTVMTQSVDVPAELQRHSWLFDVAVTGMKLEGLIQREFGTQQWPVEEKPLPPGRVIAGTRRQPSVRYLGFGCSQPSDGLWSPGEECPDPPAALLAEVADLNQQLRHYVAREIEKRIPALREQAQLLDEQHDEIVLVRQAIADRLELRLSRVVSGISPVAASSTASMARGEQLLLALSRFLDYANAGHLDGRGYRSFEFGNEWRLNRENECTAVCIDEPDRIPEQLAQLPSRDAITKLRTERQRLLLEWQRDLGITFSIDWTDAPRVTLEQLAALRATLTERQVAVSDLLSVRIGEEYAQHDVYGSRWQRRGASMPAVGTVEREHVFLTKVLLAPLREETIVARKVNQAIARARLRVDIKVEVPPEAPSQGQLQVASSLAKAAEQLLEHDVRHLEYVTVLDDGLDVRGRWQRRKLSLEEIDDAGAAIAAALIEMQAFADANATQPERRTQLRTTIGNLLGSQPRFQTDVALPEELRGLDTVLAALRKLRLEPSRRGAALLNGDRKISRVTVTSSSISYWWGVQRRQLRVHHDHTLAEILKLLDRCAEEDVAYLNNQGEER